MSSGSYLKFQSNGTTESCSFIGKVKIVQYGKKFYKAYVTEKEAHIMPLCFQYTLEVFVATIDSLRELVF